jgi:hypothetical protein
MVVEIKPQEIEIFEIFSLPLIFLKSARAAQFHFFFKETFSDSFQFSVFMDLKNSLLNLF